MHFHVAAYSISPSHAEWKEREEAAFIEGLRGLPFLAGIELPQLRGLDRWDDTFFFRHADPAWSYVATALPHTSGELRNNPSFGLSACDAASRRAAVDGISALRDSVRRAHDRLGRRAIRTVEVQSGCSGGRLDDRASIAAFTEALLEIGSWDWDGAEIVVEHCDAAIAGQAFEKGFLTVAEEVAAIRAANLGLARQIGASLNWGRSALEGRGPDAPCRHAAQLRAARLLRGMFFSGCSGTDGAYGVWKDTHMPPSGGPIVASRAPGSLLDEAEMRAFFAIANPAELAFLGVKVAIRPKDAPVAARIALLRDALTVLASAHLATA